MNDKFKLQRDNLLDKQIGEVMSGFRPGEKINVLSLQELAQLMAERAMSDGKPVDENIRKLASEGPFRNYDGLSRDDQRLMDKKLDRFSERSKLYREQAVKSNGDERRLALGLELSSISKEQLDRCGELAEKIGQKPIGPKGTVDEGLKFGGMSDDSRKALGVEDTQAKLSFDYEKKRLNGKSLGRKEPELTPKGTGDEGLRFDGMDASGENALGIGDTQAKLLSDEEKAASVANKKYGKNLRELADKGRRGVKKILGKGVEASDLDAGIRIPGPEAVGKDVKPMMAGAPDLDFHDIAHDGPFMSEPDGVSAEGPDRGDGLSNPNEDTRGSDMSRPRRGDIGSAENRKFDELARSIDDYDRADGMDGPDGPDGPCLV